MPRYFNPKDLFRGRQTVPPWLVQLSEEPVVAVEDLFLGGAVLGHLAPEEPEILLLGWLRAFAPEHPGFAATVDEAVAEWIDQAWGDTLPQKASGSARVTARAWFRAAQVVAYGEGLTRSPKVLRRRFLADPQFLRNLSEARSTDPEGWTWFALARHQETGDRSLLPHWWRLCSLPPDVPWYHAEYGIAGLRALPPENSQGLKGFPQEVGEGLILAAEGLGRRVEEGWLRESIARAELDNLVASTERAFPFPGRWKSFWRSRSGRIRGKAARDWLEKKLPKTSTDQPAHSRWARPDPSWTDCAREIASRLARNDWDALPPARSLLAEQKRFAEHLGDPSFVVRSACNFAKQVWSRRPDLALEWARLALREDPWNPYAWTTTGETLKSLGRKDEASSVFVQTISRFPENVVARNGLAESLRSQGQHEDAELVYRETVGRFPENVVARNGLAESLRSQGRYEESEMVYRETVERFPEDVVTRTGLADLLRERKRYAESETLYRRVIADNPRDSYALTGLAQVLMERGDGEQAERLLLQALKLGSNPATTHLLALVRGEAESEPEESISTSSVSDSVAESSVPYDAARPAKGEHTEVGPSKASEETAREEPKRPEGASVRVDVWQEQGVSLASAGPPMSGERSVPREEETPTDEAPGASLDLRSADIQTLLLDAYLLRRWSRQAGRGGAGVGELRRDASEVLERLLAWKDRDGRIAGEAGLLRLVEGELEAAALLLKQAVRRFPANARVRYAHARAQRELARKREVRYDPSDPLVQVRSWRRLAHLAPQFKLVQLLGEGRTWLALRDGHVVLDHARESFGELAYWFERHQLKPATEAAEDKSYFTAWWARGVQTALFDGKVCAGVDDLPSADRLRELVDRNGPDLDNLEMVFIDRFDPLPAFDLAAA